MSKEERSAWTKLTFAGSEEWLSGCCKRRRFVIDWNLSSALLLMICGGQYEWSAAGGKF
jgi:hypothetical protein